MAAVTWASARTRAREPGTSLARCAGVAAMLPRGAGPHWPAPTESSGAVRGVTRGTCGGLVAWGALGGGAGEDGLGRGEAAKRVGARFGGTRGGLPPGPRLHASRPRPEGTPALLPAACCPRTAAIPTPDPPPCTPRESRVARPAAAPRHHGPSESRAGAAQARAIRVSPGRVGRPECRGRGMVWQHHPSRSIRVGQRAGPGHNPPPLPCLFPSPPPSPPPTSSATQLKRHWSGRRRRHCSPAVVADLAAHV